MKLKSRSIAHRVPSYQLHAWPILIAGSHNNIIMKIVQLYTVQDKDTIYITYTCTILYMYNNIKYAQAGTC